MTDRHENPPLSRREARERERLFGESSRKGVRRASTAESTTAGENPDVTTANARQPNSHSRGAADSTPPAPLKARTEPEVPFSYHPPGDDAVAEHTMTRRQLRELRDAESATQGTAEKASQAETTTRPEAQVHGQGDTTAQIDAPAETATKAFKPPVGHWSIAARQEDSSSDFDHIITPSPDTGVHGTSSSALILPAMPRADDSTRPVGKTGEMLTTGSIDLPHGMGSTGQHPRFDSSELDRMFDHDDQRYETANVQTSNAEPVRASSAVSTHTSTRDVVATAKDREHRLPIVLAISAGVMAVGVVGLFVAGAIWGIF